MNEKETKIADLLLERMLKNDGELMSNANAYRLLMEAVFHRINAEKAKRETAPK